MEIYKNYILLASLPLSTTLRHLTLLHEGESTIMQLHLLNRYAKYLCALLLLLL